MKSHVAADTAVTEMMNFRRVSCKPIRFLIPHTGGHTEDEVLVPASIAGTR